MVGKLSHVSSMLLFLAVLTLVLFKMKRFIVQIDELHGITTVMVTSEESDLGSIPGTSL